MIKKRRIEEFQWTLGCNLTDDVDDKKDPALQNSDLKQKLEVNQEIGSKNLEEVLNLSFHQKLQIKHLVIYLGDKQICSTPRRQ